MGIKGKVMKLFEEMKIAKKLSFSFILIIGVIIVMAVLSYVSLQSIKSANHYNSKLLKFNHSFQMTQNGFIDQREKLLYFLLTGDRDVLVHFESSRKMVDDEFSAMKKMGEEFSVFEGTLDQIFSSYNDWYVRFANEQILLMRNHLTVNQARVIEVSGLPDEVINKFKSLSEQLSADIAREIEKSGNSIDQSIDRFSTVVLVSILSLIVLSILLSRNLAKQIAVPIVETTNIMNKMVAGDLDMEITKVTRKDEIGDMLNALTVFKENAIEQRELLKRDAEKQNLEKMRHEKLNKLALDFNATMEDVLDIVSQSVMKVMQSSGVMADNATKTGGLSQDAAVAIEEANANIETVSSASTELSASIDEISHQMSRASEVSQTAVNEVERTNTRVTSLNAAAESIGQVVQIISDIAEQTNLLALNATIEAARAGEAGKGFAVVASEVKNLATQTGKATSEISQKISEIQLETGEAAMAVVSIGDIIRRIDELTTSVASAVEQQGAATNEIARNVTEASQGAVQVARVVTSVAAAADETGKLADSQAYEISELNKNTDNLKEAVRVFLDAVKAL